jgi:hypothetical protein
MIVIHLPEEALGSNRAPVTHALITETRAENACPGRGPELLISRRLHEARLLDINYQNHCRLANSRATAIDQKQQHDDKEYTGNDPNNSDIVHVNSPYFWIKYFWKDSDIMMSAGPSVTRKREGKIKKTSGKISLILVFAACSSTLWRRWVLRVSE